MVDSNFKRKADTAVAGATIIAHGIAGSKGDAGFSERTSELMMKNDTIYCLRAVANAAGYVNFHMTWYEHEPHITPYGI